MKAQNVKSFSRFLIVITITLQLYSDFVLGFTENVENGKSKELVAPDADYMPYPALYSKFKLDENPSESYIDEASESDLIRNQKRLVDSSGLLRELEFCIECFKNEKKNGDCMSCFNRFSLNVNAAKRHKPSSKYWYSRAGRR